MALFAPTALRRSVSAATTLLPPTFLLPLRAHMSTATVSHSLETGNVAAPLVQSGHHISADLRQKVAEGTQITAATPGVEPGTRIAYATESIVARTLTPSIRTLLPLLRSQPAHYITIHIHGHPYLVTPGDTIRLPFLMPKVQPGDVLRLNRATHIGSRDYTLKAPAAERGTRDSAKKMYYLDERLFTCRATVVGTEAEPERVKEKTKRRQRHVRHVFSQHRYTVLRVSELEIKSLEEYEQAVAKEEQ